MLLSHKKHRHHFANKGPYSHSYALYSSHVQMSELDHKEGWAPKNWCFWIIVLEKTLEIRPISPKGNQPWIFIGRTDAEATILWQLNVKSQLIGKDHAAAFLYLEKIEGSSRRWQRMRQLDCMSDSMHMSLNKLRETVENKKAWHAIVHGVRKSQIRFSD